MERLIAERYMKLIEPLGFEIKMELISKIFESLRGTISKPEPEPDKEKLLNELYGAWSEVDNDFIDEIYEMRTISEKEIDFD
ncbi:MAG TPA: hypothetical protein PKC30_08475 [Saprospiraceae bacterium]|nr:hypothetical protein [Saprospiraceae bacterium]